MILAEYPEDADLLLGGVMHRISFMPVYDSESIGMIELIPSQTALLSREDVEAIRRWCDLVLSTEA